ncbi:SDR family NAD(P)-dependent oxidoreductase [Aquihabitans sp. McL0605]|uniref:SDR family NAD(P)-dependent oxidoreductase n=1 Tax=Aquihabitans sp. McL0605 TaxID=3415671 RepID=UPI003CF30E59
MPATPSFELDPDLLRGKVAVVTGASKGLGEGIAARFAELGIDVGLCARTEPKAPSGVRALTGAVDVTDSDRLEAFAGAVERQLGPIDLWVNNAGILGPVGPQRDHDPLDVAQALAVNIGGVMNGTRCFTHHGRTGPTGRRVLVNISSGAATSIYQGWSVYGATKAAVDQFTRITAAEEPGVYCYSVAPGVVDTEMQTQIRRQQPEAFPAVERFEQIHREGAWNSPAWVAEHLAGLLTGALKPEAVVYRVPDEPR